MSEIPLNREINRRRDQALRRRQRKRHFEGAVYRRLWGRRLPEAYPTLDPSHIKRILILQRNQRIGDVVVAMPVIGGLRQALPDAYIGTMVPWKLAELARVDRSVNGIIAQSGNGVSTASLWRDLQIIRREQWDAIVVLGIQAASMQLVAHSKATWQIGYSYNHRGDNLNRALIPCLSCNRSGWEYDINGVPHIVDFWSDMLSGSGVPIIPTGWDNIDLPEISDQIRELMGDHSNMLRIGLHPFSGNSIRNWPLGKFAILGRELISNWNAHLVITGGPVDGEAAQWLQSAIGENCSSLAGKASILQSWAAVKDLDLVVSVDTGMIHMAAALSTPVISLFGPGDPAIWGPRGQLDQVIQRFPLCQRCKGGRCVQSRVYCMEAISVDHVIAKVESLLAVKAHRRMSVAGDQFDEADR
jgi:heptosyltransferase-2